MPDSRLPLESTVDRSVVFEHAETSPPHSHTRGHLVHAATGVLSLLTADGSWIAPANRFAWVPAHFEHRHRAHGATDSRFVYLPPKLAASLPARPAVLVATPLARQIALALTSEPTRAESIRRHLLIVLVDEARTTGEQPLHLPEPHDARLRDATALVEANLSAPVPLSVVGRRVGVSERTLSRLFRDETGMGYRQWRTQLRVHRALVLLARGRSVSATATACGWASASQFIEQFTPLVGLTPGQYRRQATAGGRSEP